MAFDPITLRLAHPCAFAWDDLQPGERERFCNSCNKNIVDFSRFTDAELVAYLRQKPSGICGQFSDHQLERPLFGKTGNHFLHTAKRIAASALLAFGVFGNANAHAGARSNDFQETAAAPNFQIRGLVLLEGTNKPAANARITIWDNQDVVYSFFTDGEGKFSVQIDSNLIPVVAHIQIESEDNRVRYEEDVPKSELMAFFNRAIPFYTNLINENETPDQPKSDSAKTVPPKFRDKKKGGFHPFRRKPRYYRPLGCIEF